jgi:vancomycin resistance protein VanJ
VTRGEWWRRGWAVAAASVVVMALLRFHAHVPNIGNLGSLLETFLPWLGLAAVPLAAVATYRRAPLGLAAVAALTALWLVMFAGTVWPKGTSGGDLTVVTHNISASNTHVRETADDLLAAHADLLAVEEISGSSGSVLQDAFADRYPHRALASTVGLWSRFPISSADPLDLGLSWARALRAVVETDHGQVAVYVVHLASVRVGVLGFRSSQRNLAITLLADKVAADPVRRVIVMGDFNGSSYDRALQPLLDQARSAQRLAGRGFGFSWPARFPLARIDQILVRGLQPRRAWVMGRTGSDHRPVAAKLDE